MYAYMTVGGYMNSQARMDIGELEGLLPHENGKLLPENVQFNHMKLNFDIFSPM